MTSPNEFEEAIAVLVDAGLLKDDTAEIPDNVIPVDFGSPRTVVHPSQR